MLILSHFLSKETPMYGNGPGIKLEHDKQINTGDSCNTMNVSFSNHSGTHIDLPSHFNSNGKTLNDYGPGFWQFNNVELIDVSAKVNDCMIINSETLPILENIKTELLLIKTGYGRYRGTDRYTMTPPGLSSELAPFIRKKLPNLRCIGMDIISISSYSNRDEGRKAHKAFLNPDKEEPILIIEDMKLDVNGPFTKVLVAPLLINDADGSPCTIFANY